MLIQVVSESCKPLIRSFSEEILQFENKNPRIQAQFQINALTQFFRKEKKYCSVENYNCYLYKKQPAIDWMKRAITLDWMIEALAQRCSKRQVFSLAVNYMDRYLAKTDNLPLKKLQLLACGALSLANKMEGLTFDINSLSPED